MLCAFTFQLLGSLTVSLDKEVLATAELLAQADVPLLTEEQKAELDKSSRMGILKKIVGPSRYQ